MKRLGFDRDFYSIINLYSYVSSDGFLIEQGYLPLELGQKLADQLGVELNFPFVEARLRDKVRAVHNIEHSYKLTFKGDGTVERDEEEVSIGKDILDAHWPATEGRRLSKYRVGRPYMGFTAEFDFHGALEIVKRGISIVTAEIEVPTLEDIARLIPLRKDVTDDPNYKNRNLAR